MKHILLLASSIAGALGTGIPQMALASQNNQVIPVMDVVRESKQAEPEPVKSEVPIKAAPVKAPKTTKPTLVKKDEPAVEETVETYQVAPPLEYSTTTYAPYNNSVPKIFDILESADGMTLHLVGLVDAGIAKALRLKLQSNPGVKNPCSLVNRGIDYRGHRARASRDAIWAKYPCRICLRFGLHISISKRQIQNNL